MNEIVSLRRETVEAVVDWMRDQAHGFSLLGTSNARLTSTALYRLSERLDKSWESIVLPRVASGTKGRS